MALEGRVLVLAPHHALIPLLHELGLRAEAAADANAALHALIKADLGLDPFQLVIGTSAPLAASLATTQLLALPELLTATAAMYDPLRLRETIAFAFSPRPASPPIVIPGIDTVLGLENLGGDRAFYLKLLDRFWRLHQGSLAMLMAATQARRWDEVARLAHALRGSAAGVGARTLCDAADQLEIHIRDNGEPDPEQAMGLAGELGAVLAELSLFHEGTHDAGQTVAADATRAHTAMVKLDVMLSEFSGDATDFFDESAGILAAILPRPTLDALAGHLERYEFEAARALLAVYMPKTQ
jgi:HPt (histidine-containing phosphotransfer) domain-containing protein